MTLQDLDESHANLTPQAFSDFKITNPEYNPMKSRAPAKVEKDFLDLEMSINQFEKEKSGNLSKSQRVALKALKENDNLIIPNSDKGGSVVVMDSSLYKLMVLQFLDHTTTYRRLTKDPTMVFGDKLCQLLLDGSALGVINEKECKLLLPSNPVIFSIPLSTQDP